MVFKKGIVAWNKGSIMPEEYRKMVSESVKRFHKDHPYASGYKKHHTVNVGRKVSEETKRKIGDANRNKTHPSGDKHYNWKGGVTSKDESLRKCKEYKIWRRAVFERDSYTCVWCGQHGGTLNADHIKPFALYPELRFAIDNGRTLCIKCHRTINTWFIRRSRKVYNLFGAINE